MFQSKKVGRFIIPVLIKHTKEIAQGLVRRS